MKRFSILFCVSAAMTLSVDAQRTHDITIDDYFSLSYISDAQVSPDGAWVAYVEQRWDESIDKRNADLWVVSTQDKRRARLTFDSAADTNPQWGADGELYFTSSRKQGEEKAKTQVWRVGVGGGAPVAVTNVTHGVDQFEIAADGSALYYTTSSESADKDAWKELREEFSDVEYGHGVVDRSQLWRLDLESWRAEKLYDDGRVIGEFHVTPNQQRIAMITTPDNTLLSNEGWSLVQVLDVESGKLTTLDDEQWREQAPSPYGWIVEPCWSSDSSAFAFRVDFDGYPGEVFVARFGDRATKPSIMKMKRPAGDQAPQVSVEGLMQWRPGTADLCFLAEDHARERVMCVQGLAQGRQDRAVTLTPGDVVVDDFSFDTSGHTLALVRSGLNHTSDVFVHYPNLSNASSQRLTNINPQVDTWKLPSIEIVRWTSADGTKVEGILELPPGYKERETKEPLPLLVEIHGGPTASSKYSFRYWMYGRTLYAAQGWAMLSPNYRGSTGYGDKFLTELIGHKNDRDVADILAGVDMLIDRGIADPDRMAVGGWSNGGYLTNCLIAADQRFAAASSGAGVFDTVMQWSIEDTPGHVINYSTGLPWEKANVMHRTSPLYHAANITTPTIIHVGENDPRVPAEHSRALHRALHHYLNVPAELIVYPGEGHGLTKMSHRRAKMNWDYKWFEHYVLGKSAADLENRD